MSQVAEAKLDALEDICVKLEALANVESDAEVLYPLSTLIATLRSVLDHPVNAGVGPLAALRQQVAMNELSFWSLRCRRWGVDADALCAFLSAELALLARDELDANETFFLSLCRRTWRVLEERLKPPETGETFPAESCGDADCGACAAPSASES